MPARVAVVVLAAWVAAGPLQAQAGAIVGRWRGTSTCVKENWNSACNDEQVVYDITAVPGRADSVSLDAQKLVDGKPESMGVLLLGYQTASASWVAEWSNARYHLLWTFQASGAVLTGTLVLLPSRRVARHVSVKKE